MDALIEQMVQHARDSYPRECCGLVVLAGRKPKYLRCDNVSVSPLEEFRIDPQQYAEAEALGEVVRVVHSHPDVEGYFSPFDMDMYKAAGLAWTIIGLPNGPDGEPHVVELDAPGPLPLKGRQFRHGVIDCYTLIRDYYQQVRGISLPDFAREDDWWLKGQDLYEENFRKAGFVPTLDPQPGDVILMRIRAEVSNHAAILLESGEILHHLPKNLSCSDIYREFYRERTSRFLRYVGPTDTQDDSPGR